MTERTYRTLGGVCANGHLLTHETAYVVPYDAQYRHRKRPPGPKVRCALCLQASTRRRLNQQPRTRIDPDALHTCRCGATKPRRAFGIRRHNQDGTIQYHSTCGSCRGRISNARVKEAARRRREQEAEERAELTRWVIASAWRLKRECGMPVAEVRDRLGVPQQTWSRWRRGAQLPELGRLRTMVETVRQMLVSERLV